MDRLHLELLALTDPANGKVALGVRESKTVGDTEVRVRGEAEKLGPIVPRGFLSVLKVPGAPKINQSQSGRLELAEWLASEQNPLTRRVIVNRAWQHLFGQGLVKTSAIISAFSNRRRAVASGAAEFSGRRSRFVTTAASSVKKLVRRDRAHAGISP